MGNQRYRDADIYLMDDPLSAVDPHVRKHLFDKASLPASPSFSDAPSLSAPKKKKAIVGFLAGKTRVLVTHQLQYLPGFCSKVLVFSEGRITKQGVFSQASLPPFLDKSSFRVPDCSLSI